VTTHKPHGAVPPLPPVEAPAPILAEARANCADRLRARGSEAEAEMFATGQRDDTWAMRFELAKLRAERGEG